MTLGDRNTSFFFRCAKARKGRNEIRILQDENGGWVFDRDKIMEIITNHFKDLYMVDNGRNEEWRQPESLKTLITMLSTDHINILQKDFDEYEVRKEIFQMGGLKAPGPDGIPAVFYHKSWEVVGKEVTEAVLHFFQNGVSAKRVELDSHSSYKKDR